MATSSVESTRRVPTQQRSRRRVEAVLDATAELVAHHGVDGLTTRDIAAAAGVPVASIYQYFADKEAVLLALAARDVDEMHDQVAQDLLALVGQDGLTLAEVVRAAMTSFVAFYHRHQAFVHIYLRGRTNAAVHAFGREHNATIAADLLVFARELGIAGPDLTEVRVGLAVEIGDRVFQLAFETDDQGDPVVIEEGITMMTCYLERYAGR